ncbi:hypothetical protein NQZ68_007319 [Dissostichus eleginoides]|nr:hypothetical protein NQZ68_007319 [Dissostichus eleginoides]
MLMCDQCRLCYHFGCLDPPLKKSPKQTGYGWICQDCDTSSSKFTSALMEAAEEDTLNHSNKSFNYQEAQLLSERKGSHADLRLFERLLSMRLFCIGVSKVTVNGEEEEDFQAAPSIRFCVT